MMTHTQKGQGVSSKKPCRTTPELAEALKLCPLQTPKQQKRPRLQNASSPFVAPALLMEVGRTCPLLRTPRAPRGPGRASYLQKGLRG